jgi:hypothetical protein
LIGRAAHPIVELRMLLHLAALAMTDRHDAARTPVRKPTVTTMSQSAEPKSSGQIFLSAAAQWRRLAASAAQREAVK